MLVCSPEFYAQHDEPKVLGDITAWHWIKLQQLSNSRKFLSDDNSETEVSFLHHVSVNNVEAMSYLCQQGLGLSTLAECQAKELVAQGKLIHVLPSWRVESIPFYALWSANVFPTSLSKRLLRFLE